MKFTGRLFGLASLVLLLSCFGRTALADDQPYKALLADGYEIRSVVFLDPAFTTRYGNKIDNTDTVVVTLQKGPSSAVCYWYAAAWITQALNDKTCAVFK